MEHQNDYKLFYKRYQSGRDLAIRGGKELPTHFS